MAKSSKQLKKAVKKTVKRSKPKKAAKKPVRKPAAKVAPSKARKSPVKTQKKQDEALQLAHAVVEGMLEKKAENIICLDLRKIGNAITDLYVICEANSNIQVEAIADSVEETVKKRLGQRPYRSEGWENSLWILIDYINVVVHVFERETRYFYNLESLWADADKVKL